MRLSHLPDKLLVHLSVAVAVLVASSALASASLGVSSQEAPPSPSSSAVDPPPTFEPYAMLSDVPDLPRGHGGTVPSSRGGRPWRGPSPAVTISAAASTATPIVATSATMPPAGVSVAMSLAVEPIVTATEAPRVVASPTATPAPTLTPTPVPPTPARVPTAPPASPSPAPSTSSISQLRVGLQVGHWKNSELPAELAGLRGSTGAAGNGWKEVEVNLEVANRAARILKEAGVQVDLIPATVPVAYKAHAFVAIHGDANGNPSASGYKLARARWSKIPQKEDDLIRAISTEYQAATGLRDHPNSITENMRQYYAFNWQSLKHAVDSATPSVILELGFLTTAGDRKLLLEQPERAAEGVAKGILRFLGR